MREWIETKRWHKTVQQKGVSLCVREWIETDAWLEAEMTVTVSLCVREWIETSLSPDTMEVPLPSPSA